MSLSIQQSVVEIFNFDGEDVRSNYIHGEGQCIVASDVYKAVGYSRRAGVQEYSDLSQGSTGCSLETLKLICWVYSNLSTSIQTQFW